jgi:type II secretory pathway pseudopilin PulG
MIYPFWKKKTMSGFTTLELLVVIFVMGVLIALVLAGFGGGRERTRDSIRIAGVNNMVLIVEQFRSICRHYPVSIDDITNPIYCSTYNPVPELALDQLIREPPELPDGDEFYYAAYAANQNRSEFCTGFHIGVRLEGSQNTALEEDDDADGQPISVLCDGSTNDFEGDSRNAGDTEDYMYDLVQ